MKVNLEQPLKSWSGKILVRNEVRRDDGGFPIFVKDNSGKPVRNRDGELVYETDQVPMTLRAAISDLCDRIEQEDSSEVKNKLEQIQKKTWNNDEASYTIEQIVLINGRADKYASLVIRHRLREILDPESQNENPEKPESKTPTEETQEPAAAPETSEA